MNEKANQFWHDLDAQLNEEEQALAEFRDYLNGLSIEEAECAVNGLNEYLREQEHVPVDELVMGWERRLLDEE